MCPSLGPIHGLLLCGSQPSRWGLPVPFMVWFTERVQPKCMDAWAEFISLQPAVVDGPFSSKVPSAVA